LQAENPGVDVTVVEVQKEGVCIRFSPLDSAQGMISLSMCYKYTFKTYV